MSIETGELKAKVHYFGWAAARIIGADTTCPACGRRSTQLVRRKYLVTALYECPNCHIRFRVPKESNERADDLYNKETYRQGFTTTLPSQAALDDLLRIKFAGTEKDFAPYIKVIKSYLPSGARILDFGCSWGYGSWQIRQAGFEVSCYEIGEMRARYAKERLGCTMVDDLRTLDGTVDCLFSSHVIEHLPDPGILMAEARKLLAPGGYFISFCPNGNPERRDRNYHRYWNKVHPLLITPEFMRWAIRKNGLTECEIAAGDNMVGPELLAVARKNSTV